MEPRRHDEVMVEPHTVVDADSKSFQINNQTLCCEKSRNSV